MAADLPQAMLTEILIRLDVKSLLISKAVCKPWLHLISTPLFINSHLQLVTLNDPSLLHIVHPLQTPTTTILDPHDPDEIASQLRMQRKQQLVNQALVEEQELGVISSVSSVRVVLPRLFQDMRFWEVSTCNGIVCLDNVDEDVVYLWNPLIRKGKKLPATSRGNDKFYLYDIGFGYDSVCDDYKVVRIGFEKLTHLAPTIQVYSANADSWKIFMAPVLKNFRFCMFSSIVLNGVLYFHDLAVLFSFDLHSEIIKSVPFPVSVKEPETHTGFDLLDFEGSVAVLIGNELWTLDDVSGQMSWTKRFSIETDLETQVRLSFCLGGGQFYGRLMLNNFFFMYHVLYDCEKKRAKFYEIQDMRGTLKYTLKYTETLVSLDGFEKME